ncbi:hypothetical protein ACFU3E_07485 [Streptomyces sp. NPDC057424]|uniref:hypothetical protein n=1 Tax=Streptomyces sp. NPDC057424 TaxID=3346127 RepID=UPI0036D1B927
MRCFEKDESRCHRQVVLETVRERAAVYSVVEVDVEPLGAPSLCAIKRDQEERGTSLGVFRPTEASCRLTAAEPWSDSKAALADQTRPVRAGSGTA